MKLRLIDHLFDLFSRSSDIPYYVYGVYKNGCRLTLTVAGVRQEQDSGPQTVIVGAAMFGEHVDLAGLAVSQLSLSFAHLNSWASRRPIRASHDEQHRQTWRLENRPALDLKIPGASASLQIWSGGTFLPAYRARVSAQEMIVLDLDAPMPFNEAIANFVSPLEALFSLFTGERQLINRLGFQSPTLPERNINGDDMGFLTTVDVIGLGRPDLTLEKESEPETPSFFGRGAPVPLVAETEPLVVAWFNDAQLYTTTGPVLDYVTADLPDEARLLALAATADKFHRTYFPDFAPAREADERRLAAITQGLSIKNRRWLANATRSIFNPSFRDRMNHLMDGLPAEVAHAVLQAHRGGPSFVDRVVESRHTYAHTGQAGERQRELRLLCTGLEYLLRAHIFLRLGVSAEDLRRVMALHPQYRDLFGI